MTTAIRTPYLKSASYRAAAHLYQSGPLSRAELFDQVHFSDSLGIRNPMLERAIRTGWLVETPEGVTISADAREHFDDRAGVAPKPQGQVAGPRVTMPFQDRPQLSRKYIPNVHGTRNDVPVFSVRDGVRFLTQA